MLAGHTRIAMLPPLLTLAPSPTRNTPYTPTWDAHHLANTAILTQLVRFIVQHGKMFGASFINQAMGRENLVHFIVIQLPHEANWTVDQLSATKWLLTTAPSQYSLRSSNR